MAKTTTKPTVRFTARAYQQMFALVDACDIEISAMGFTATEEEKRKEGVKEDFYITEFRPVDQECSGAYTEMTADALTEQLMDLREEGWDNPGLRRNVHMHSHVNMGVSQSSIDESWIEKIADNELLGDVGIFIIANKKRDLNVRIEMYKPFRQSFEKCKHIIDQIDILPDGWGEEMVEKYVRTIPRVVETLTDVKRAAKTRSWSYNNNFGSNYSSRHIVSNGNRVLHGNTWMWEDEDEEEQDTETVTKGYEYDYDAPDLTFPDELAVLQSAYDEGEIDVNEAVQLFGKWSAKDLSAEEVEQELEEVHNYTLVGNPADDSDEEEDEFVYMTDTELLKKGVC